MNLNYNNEKLSLTFSKKALTTFIDNLYTLIDYEVSVTKMDETWKTTWDTWKLHGLRHALTRKKLSDIVLGKEYDHKSLVVVLQLFGS